MILLDTHVWIWWTIDVDQLTEDQIRTISENEDNEIGVSAISCWEIAKLVERGRLGLPWALPEWFETALGYPGITLLGLTPEIAIESTRLPGEFHRDPADQIIVATARINQCQLVSSDEKIRRYPHVSTVY